MPDLAHHLSRLLQSYTYPVLVALVLLESVGIPLPGEIALVTAAAYASRGHISIYIVIILAAAAAIVGGILGYWIGIRGGLPLVVRYGGYVGGGGDPHETTHALFWGHRAKKNIFWGVFTDFFPMGGGGGGGGATVFREVVGCYTSVKNR